MLVNVRTFLAKIHEMFFVKLSKKVRVMIYFLVGVVSLCYIVNAVVIFLFSPGNIQGNDEPSAHIVEHNNVGEEVKDFVVYDGLKSGGLGVFGWNADPTGYVNMISDDSTVYVNNSAKDRIFEDNQDGYYSTFYRHESAHIKQKEMIAKKSGGYPTWKNPLQSFKYYKNLYKLNKTLESVMPNIKENSKTSWFATKGLEASADCYAQPLSYLEKPIIFKASYVKNGHCSNKQAALAKQLDNTDKWFDPNFKTEFDDTTNNTTIISPKNVRSIQINDEEKWKEIRYIRYDRRMVRIKFSISDERKIISKSVTAYTVDNIQKNKEKTKEEVCESLVNNLKSLLKTQVDYPVFYQTYKNKCLENNN